MMRLVAVCFFLVTALATNVSADASKGQSTYAARGCIGCHGAGGKSVVPTYPSLQGQSAAYVRKNLTDFRSGARKNPVMNAMTSGLSDEDIANLADYIGSLR